MKKTIIAMLALSGVAFGATAGHLNSYLDALGIADGTSFTLNLTFDSTGDRAALLELTEDTIFVAQINQYLGVTTGYETETKPTDPGNWEMKGITSETVTEGGKETTTYYINGEEATVAEANELKAEAFNDSITLGSSKGWLVDAGGNGLSNLTMSISTMYYGTLGMTTVSIGGGELASITTNLPVDLSDIDFTTNASVAQLIIGDVTHDLTQDVPAIPEPTTATLSLLALAGLAARRRRK